MRDLERKMTLKEFLVRLDEIVELPAGSLHGDEKLEDLEGWNSLAMLSFMAMVDEHCNLRLSPRQFVNCETVSDLAALARVPSI